MKTPFDKVTVGIINEDLKEIIILLLDFFSEETDLVIALYSPDGREIWCACEQRFSKLCGFFKAHPKLWSLCIEDHSHRATINCEGQEKSQLSMCHLGLWNMTYSLMLDNIYYGSLLTGQKKLFDDQKNQLTNKTFYSRIEKLKELNLINDKDASAMINCFNAVEQVPDIESLSLKNIVRIEEKLIGLINNLLKRVRKITLLRHEIHQPNIAVMGSLTKVIDKLENMNRLVDPQSPVAKEFTAIIQSLKYSKNASRLFSTIIENICTSLSDDELTLSLERHNILEAIEEARNIFEIEESVAQTFFN